MEQSPCINFSAQRLWVELNKARKKERTRAHADTDPYILQSSRRASRHAGSPPHDCVASNKQNGKAHEESKIHHLFASRSPPFFLFSNERLSPRGGGGGEDLGRRLWGAGEVVRRGTARPAGIMAAVRRGSWYAASGLVAGTLAGRQALLASPGTIGPDRGQKAHASFAYGECAMPVPLTHPCFWQWQWQRLLVCGRAFPATAKCFSTWNCLIRLTRLDTYEGYKQCALLWLCKCGGGSHELLHDHKNSDAKRWIDYYR